MFMEETWKLQVPTKVKNFMWRVSIGILPTNVSLALKGVNITTGCKVCGINEDDLYVLLHYFVAVEYWRILGFSILDQNVLIIIF